MANFGQKLSDEEALRLEMQQKLQDSGFKGGPDLSHLEPLQRYLKRVHGEEAPDATAAEKRLRSLYPPETSTVWKDEIAPLVQIEKNKQKTLASVDKWSQEYAEKKAAAADPIPASSKKWQQDYVAKRELRKALALPKPPYATTGAGTMNLRAGATGGPSSTRPPVLSRPRRSVLAPAEAKAVGDKVRDNFQAAMASERAKGTVAGPNLPSPEELARMQAAQLLASQNQSRLNSGPVNWRATMPTENLLAGSSKVVADRTRNMMNRVRLNQYAPPASRDAVLQQATGPVPPAQLGLNQQDGAGQPLSEERVMLDGGKGLGYTGKSVISSGPSAADRDRILARKTDVRTQGGRTPFAQDPATLQKMRFAESALTRNALKPGAEQSLRKRGLLPAGAVVAGADHGIPDPTKQPGFRLLPPDTQASLWAKYQGDVADFRMNQANNAAVESRTAAQVKRDEQKDLRARADAAAENAIKTKAESRAEEKQNVQIERSKLRDELAAIEMRRTKDGNLAPIDRTRSVEIGRLLGGDSTGGPLKGLSRQAAGAINESASHEDFLSAIMQHGHDPKHIPASALKMVRDIAKNGAHPDEVASLLAGKAEEKTPDQMAKIYLHYALTGQMDKGLSLAEITKHARRIARTGE